MNNIPISLARNWQSDSDPQFNEIIQQLSDTLNIKVTPELMDWSDFADRMKSIADDKESVTVSEIGSTWLADFNAGNHFHRFTESELQYVLGEDNFLLRNIDLSGRLKKTNSIPWLADSQVLFYWRDMIDTSNVDPATDFSSIQNFEQALAKISQKSLRYPLAISTWRTIFTMHQLSSWIWSSGGDIIDESGTNIHLLDIKSVQSMTHYFSLVRFIPEYGRVTPSQMVKHFAERQAALTLGGTRTYALLKAALSPDQMKHIGVALPPGVPFVGAEHLVMWDHITDSQKEQGLHFLKAFLSSDIHQQFTEMTGLLPANPELLNTAYYQDDEFLRTIAAATQIGRTYPAIPQWTAVESLLLDMIEAIWDDVITNQESDIENVVFRHVIRFGQTVRQILS